MTLRRFSDVSALLQHFQFDAVVLIRAAGAIDAQAFSPNDIADVEVAAKTRPSRSVVLRFCQLLQQKEDENALLATVEAARTLGSLDSLATSIENAILYVCLNTENNSSTELGLKKAVLAKLLDIFKRLNLSERETEFTSSLENGIVKCYEAKYRLEAASSSQTAYLLPLFNVFGMPRFAVKYHGRERVENTIRREIQGIAMEPEQGVLAIVGFEGVGKTTTLAHLVSEDKAFFHHECKLNTTIWINCYQWRDTFGESDQAAFVRKLCETCHQADPSIPETSLNLKDVVALLERRSRPLFVLDDLLNVEVLVFFRTRCPNTVCCVVTPCIYGIYLRDTLAFGVRLLGSVVSISELDDSEAKMFLHETHGLSGSLTEEQLAELGRMALGSPLLTSLIYPHFLCCRTESDYQGEYAELAKQLSNSKSLSETLETLFQMTMEKIGNDRTRTMFYAFLLFDPEEPISVGDLAILWGYKSDPIDIAVLPICNRYEKMSLIKELTQGVNDQNKKLFCLHGALHQVTNKFAIKEARVDTIYELRLKLLTGLLWKDETSNDGGALLYRIVELQNRLLLEQIFRNLDAGSLLKICQLPSPTEGYANFLQFLFDWHWPDDVWHGYDKRTIVRHSFRLLTAILLKLCRQNSQVKIKAVATSAPKRIPRRPSSLPSYVLNGRPLDLVLRQKNGPLGSSFLDQVSNAAQTWRRNDDYENLRLILGPWLNGTGKVNELEVNCHRLMMAVKLGFEDTVKRLVAQNPEVVEMADKFYQRTPLSWAASGNGNLGLVKFLVEKFPQAVELKDSDGRTSLSLAAESNGIEVVRFLYEAHPEAIEMLDNERRSALSWAVENCDAEVAKFLAEKYPQAAKIIDVDGRTPLAWAAQLGNESIVTFLCEKCPEAGDYCDIFGRTPLSIAAYCNTLEVVKVLVENFPRAISAPDRYDQTPLTRAARRGDAEFLLKFLFEKHHKAVEMANRAGRTPLSYASEFGNVETVAFLFEKFPKAAEIVDTDGRTPLAIAAESNNFEIVKFLVRKFPKGAEMSDNRGVTPLARAVYRNNVEMVKFLYEKWPNAVEMQDQDGLTPLSWAAYHDNVELVRFLYEKYPKAVEMKDRHGLTPLARAAYFKTVGVNAFLVEKMSEDHWNITP